MTENYEKLEFFLLKIYIAHYLLNFFGFFTDSTLQYFVKNEEMFEVLHEAHLKTGHGGRNRMIYELQKHYKNTTQQAVMIFLKLCVICQLKSHNTKKGLVVKPMVFSTMNERCQVDLVDMQSNADGAYKFIMVYQDHLTKFCIIRPLKTKTAAEVAREVLDIFCIFGAPSIMQSDNGREFVNAIIEELTVMWKGLKIVHGKPRHSQSQGSVEKANQDVQDMVMSWMEQEGSTHWSEALKFVQFMKNQALHSGINRAPYRSMFGNDAKFVLASTSIPKTIYSQITTKEELETVLAAAQPELTPTSGQVQQQSEEMDQTQADSGEMDQTQADSEQIELQTTQIQAEEFHLIDAYQLEPLQPVQLEDIQSELQFSSNELQVLQPVAFHQEETQTEPVLNSMDEFGLSDQTQLQSPQKCTNCTDEKSCNLCTAATNIRTERAASRCHLQKQASRMLKRSNSKFPRCKVGDTVRVAVPDVDRGRGDFRNVLMAILEVDEKGFYKLGNYDGTIGELFSRNQFTPTNAIHLDLSQISKEKKSLRQLASIQSKFGGQGYQRCSCRGGCDNKKCSCKAKGLLCNSKCHKSLPCKNK